MNRLELDHRACLAHPYYFAAGRVESETARVKHHEYLCRQCRRELNKDCGVPPWTKGIRWQSLPSWLAYLIGEDRLEWDRFVSQSIQYRESPPSEEEDGTDLFAGEEVNQDDIISELAMGGSDVLYGSGVSQGTMRETFQDLAEVLEQEESEADLAWSLGDNGELTEREKLVLYLAAYWHHGLADIAALLGVKTATVTRYLKRAATKARRAKLVQA